MEDKSIDSNKFGGLCGSSLPFRELCYFVIYIVASFTIFFGGVDDLLGVQCAGQPGPRELLRTVHLSNRLDPDSMYLVEIFPP